MATPIDWRITWAVDHLQQHLTAPLSIPELAARVSLSPSRFRELFRAHTGLGPVQYLQQQRLRRARLLIERTFLTVKEVMSVVGYSDASQFSRDFRRHHGVSPSSLRGRGVATALPAADEAPGDTPDGPRIRRRRAREPGTLSNDPHRAAVGGNDLLQPRCGG